jgi:hypothetical protein
MARGKHKGFMVKGAGSHHKKGKKKGGRKRHGGKKHRK